MSISVFQVRLSRVVSSPCVQDVLLSKSSFDKENFRTTSEPDEGLQELITIIRTSNNKCIYIQLFLNFLSAIQENMTK